MSNIANSKKKIAKKGVPGPKVKGLSKGRKSKAGTTRAAPRNSALMPKDGKGVKAPF